MTGETMTRKERMEAALHLEKPDRVPIAPEMWYGAVAELMDIDRCTHANKSAIEMLDDEVRCFDDFGGWDGIQGLPQTGDIFTFLGLKLSKPTPENPVWQILEQENMTYDEYDVIADIGWDAYLKEILIPRVAGWDAARIQQALDEDEAMYDRAMVEYDQNRGCRVMFRAWAPTHPFFILSLARSMLKFTEDIYYRPEKIHKALQRMTEDSIKGFLETNDTYHHNIAAVTEERAGAFFYPLDIFEKFWWPYTEQFVDAFWAKGITTQFHLDTPWDKNLHYWKKLPKGSFGFHLDSTTNIFAAKEMFRGQAWFIGDVSATLFSLGDPGDVEAYVKKLIDEVGDDGGFILGSGCNVPNKVTRANFKAFIDTAKTYEFSKK